MRIVDTKVLPGHGTIAAALVEVDPGAMRELHWHPNTDEWQYYIEGQARMGVFAASGQARTFDYQAGDVGFVPFAMGHYIENTGDTTLRFLEMFKSDYYADVSLNQWLALTPPGTGQRASEEQRAADPRLAQGQGAGRAGIGSRPVFWKGYRRGGAAARNCRMFRAIVAAMCFGSKPLGTGRIGQAANRR